MDNPDGDSAVTKNRKLLARILIKGEANITSAAISDAGSLLVVSTTNDIRAFHLKFRGDGRKDELKISKVEIPEGLAQRGATRIQIAPDGQWLCLVRESSNICLFKLVQESDSEGKPAIHPKAIRLQRIGRKIPKNIALGGLGQYERTVSHIAFSPDSRMLAVADQAGYIDTWVLRQPTPKSQNGLNSTHEDSASDAITSDDEDENSEDTISGDLRWMRNPSAALIPRLHAAPTVLSFSGHIPNVDPRPQRADYDGHESPDDYILLAVTAKPQILLLNPSLGSMTAWSRRNPISRFPVEFRNTRDLIKGALWAGDRVWLYGNNFLAMLDLTKDFATVPGAGPESRHRLESAPAAITTTNGQQLQQGRKRKRGPDTGAGNKMEIGALGPTKITRHVRGQQKAEELTLDTTVPDPMDTDATSGPGEEEDDDGEGEGESESESEGDERRGELALLRGTQQQGKQRGRQGAPDGSGNTASAGGDCNSDDDTGPIFWCTYKYRPILGVVPLAPSDDENTVSADPTHMNGKQQKKKAPTLEVALVERPMWEVDLPDRYFADGEYDR